MLTKEFYKAFDAELSNVIDRYSQTSSFFKKHKQDSNQRAFAFMIWFLQFYSRVNGLLNYITDSEDDGSCDLMFPYYNEFGEVTYCVVQSKWKSESNCEKFLEDKEVFKALRRFETILNGEKQHVNEGNYPAALGFLFFV